MATADFTSYLLATSETDRTAPNRVRNAAIRNRYAWAYTTRGMSLEKLMGGGDPMSVRLQLRNKGSFRQIGINDPQTASMAQLITKAQLPWIEGIAEASWNDREVVMTSGSEYTDDYRYTQWLNYKEFLMGNLAVDNAEGVEDAAWALPNPTTMAGLNASAVMSFLTYNNDHMATSGATNGNFYSVAAGAQLSDVMGITNTNASTKRWKQKIAAYNSQLAEPAADTKNAINAFDEIYHQIRYVPPSSAATSGTSQWEDDMWPQMVSFTSLKGITHIQDLTRKQGDRWTGNRNPDNAVGGPFGGPMYGGMEHVYVPALDTVTAYLNSYTSPTTAVTEGDNAGAGRGPRYYLFNVRDGVCIGIHKDRNFIRKPVRQYDNGPSTNTIWGSVYFNFFSSARWLNAVIAPGTTSLAWPDVTYTPGQIFTAY